MEDKYQSLDSLVNMIFSKDPKPECTYNIKLSEQSDITPFQFLMTFLIQGAKFLYGENITPNDISETQFQTLKSYMESIGYRIKHNYKYLDQFIDLDMDESLKPRFINIWFEEIIPKYNCHGIRIYN